MTEIVHVYLVPFAIKVRFRCSKIVVFILLLLECFHPSSAQQKTFLPLTKLEIKNGLPGINIRKITKDQFGFMWFATQDGISRFDGRSYINFNSYNTNEKRRLLGTDVYDILPDMNGKYLWALSAYGGLNKIELSTCNVVGRYEVNQSTKHDTTLWYKCMVENSRYLYIGTFQGIISRFDKESQKTDYSFSMFDQYDCSGDLANINIDTEGRIWISVGKKILVTDESLTKKLTIIDSSTLGKATFTFTGSCVHGRDLFFTTSTGLSVVNTKTFTTDNSFARLIDFCSGKELHCI